MLQINAELYFRSINEKHALTFLISTACLHFLYNIFFVYLMSDFPLRVLYYEQEKHLRRYCLAGTSYVSQPAFTCSKLTIETLEQGVKYVQS